VLKSGLNEFHSMQFMVRGDRQNVDQSWPTWFASRN